MTIETLRFALGGVAAYRHILETPELGLVRGLLDKLARGDGAGAAEDYASLFFALRCGRYAGLGDWLHDQLRYTESPYAQLVEEGDSDTALEEAARHTDLSAVLIDEEASTVQITDPELRLDVGAIAKGYAVEQVCREAPAGLLVSVGGNVRATGPKADGQPWVVGIQSPDGEKEDFLHTVELSGGSVVTSGDYQRYYTVDGVRYHHIIDPQTLCPAAYWRSVTIICADSGLADALSTALFTLPQEDGQAILDRWGAQAMWVDASGQRSYSPGFSDLIRT